MGDASVMAPLAPVAVRFIALPPPSIVPLTDMAPTVLSVSEPPVAVTLPLTKSPPVLSAMLIRPAVELVVPRLVMVLDTSLRVTLLPETVSVVAAIGPDWVIAPLAVSVTVLPVFAAATSKPVASR